MGREEQVAPVDKVRTERRDDVLVITIDNPPTAALSGEVRSLLMKEVEAGDEDAALKAMVITGSNGAFATGAGAEYLLSLTPTAARLTAHNNSGPEVISYLGKCEGAF